MKPDWKKMGGLLPAVVQDDATGAVLMVGYMNAAAFARTQKTGKVTFFSVERIDHSKSARALAPAEGPTAEYGDYIVHTAGCAECHGPTLAGGKIDVGDPSWPPAANLTPSGLKAYDEAAFFTALRTGVRPGGSKINEAMPWRRTKEMTDDEIRAVWLYLKTVPPREFGAR